MARPKNPIPSYRKHASGQARVTINGRDYLLGLHGTKASKREYDRLVAEYLASGRSASFGIEPQSLRLSMLMVAYLKHSPSYYGIGRTSEYHRITLALKLVRELYARSPAAEFGPTQLKAVREWMIGQDHSRTYINANIKRIVRMFRWGAEEELVPESVHRTLRLVAGLKRGKTKARETKPVKPVPLEVVEATIEELLPTFAAMVRIQLLTGCRPGEVCKLTPGMIDRSGDVWVAKLHEHKTAIHDHERYLYFGPKAQAVLRPFLLRGPDEYLFRPADTIKPEGARQRKPRDAIVVWQPPWQVESQNQGQGPRSRRQIHPPSLYSKNRRSRQSGRKLNIGRPISCVTPALPRSGQNSAWMLRAAAGSFGGAKGGWLL